MLKKIIKIKNIGKFRDCHASGDVEFRAMTLIYAENGRGKTTLCDILHSLGSGNPEHINGRQTLDCGDEPEVTIRLDADMAIFKDGSWNKTYPDIAVFDMTFVHQNVYAGDYVDHDHKKNLYRVIVGEEGVKLTQAVDDLDSQIRDLNKDISNKRSVAEKYVPKGISLEVFLPLAKDNDIDRKILEAEAEVAALERSNEISNRKALGTIMLPKLPDNFHDLLGKQLEDVSQDAEALVHEHLKLHTERAGETWLTKGLDYLKDDTCPFCGQPILGNKLIDAYRIYFGASYLALKEEISSLQSTVATQLGEASLLKLQKTISENETLSVFWKQFMTFQDPTISFEDHLQSPLSALRTVSLTYIQQKVGTPLEPIVPDSDFEDALSQYEEAKLAAKAYNIAVDQVNKLINEKKAKTQSGNLAEAKKTLECFKAIKQRHEPKASQACRDYQDVVDKKGDLERQKREAKAKLDEYTAKILPKYERRINQLLQMFYAGFRIGGTTRKYIGGTPSTFYQIVIDGISVPLGDAELPLGTASFRNTLSAGDRSTLALAFFLAQMEHDSQLSQKVVVFDDPLTSQDRSRRTCTQQLVCELRASSKQVVVLSHDQGFLKLIWDNVTKSDTKTLQLSRMGQNTIITQWDIEDATRDEYAKNHALLSKYCNFGDGDPRLVAKTIRPLLEHYLRVKFPDQFMPSDWLGDFIDKIRDADEAKPLHGAQVILPELEAINSYSKKYHHDVNDAADTELIDDGELAGYVKRALDLVGGF